MYLICHSCHGQFSLPPGYTGMSCTCPFCGAVNVIHSNQSSEEGEIDLEGENTWKESFLIPKEAIIALSIGLSAALIISLGDFKFTRFIIHHFVTLVHEFGHAFFSWLQGYFAIPAFDFTHGGGIAITNEKASMGIRVAVFVSLTLLAWKFHKYKLILIPTIILILALFFSIITNNTELVLLYMGHGTVVIMAGIFLFRGLSNVAVHNSVERILYFFLGFFCVIEEFIFTEKIIKNPGFRGLYLEGKGGVLNDFDRIADYLGVSLNQAVGFHSVVCLLTPPISYLIYVVVVKNYSR